MVGERVGGYTLIELLGRGGAGAVWRACPSTAPDDRSQDVAIKRLTVRESGTDQERFRREADALAKVSHPNVIRIHDVVADGPGIALVLELAHQTLAQLLDARGPLTAGEVQDICAPIAQALHCAHSVGLVHRDVKPANIFLTATGKPMLGDFGIAHDVGRTQITLTEAALGTAAYLDPRILNGADPDAQSDQYGLGITMYEALTGTLPYAGAVPMAVIKAAEEARFLPLDRAKVGSLASVVERSFSRNPTERFLDLGQLATAIEDPERPELLEESTNAFRTTAFRRKVRNATLAEAAPVQKTRRPWLIASALTVAVAVLVAALTLRGRDKNTSGNTNELGLPSCSERTQTQCVRSFVRTPNGMQVSFADGRTATYRVGEKDDALRVNNWICGDRATLALYRPRTGVLYFFDSWPDSRVDSVVRVATLTTGLLNGRLAETADRDGNRCADIAITVPGDGQQALDNGPTWFLPSERTDLVPVPSTESGPIPGISLTLLNEKGVIDATTTTSVGPT
jgi:serine/threonine protein kinase